MTELSEGRLCLRPLKLAHAPAVFEAVRQSLPELSAWMPWCHPGYALDETRVYLRQQPARWKKGDEYSFGIWDAVSGRFVGGCGINQVDRATLRANLGYWVRSSDTGRGIATTAARLVARFGLSTLDFQRLEIVAAVSNLASQRVAEKAGAVREGIARGRLRVGGRQLDAVVYSLLRGDVVPPASDARAARRIKES